MSTAFFQRFISDRRGNTLMSVGLVMPIMMSGVGMAVDFSMWFKQKDKLQAVADSAAISAAGELSRSGTLSVRSQRAVTIGEGFVDANAPGRQRTVSVSEGGSGIEVSISEPALSAFGGLFGLGDMTLSVTGRASAGDLDGRACIIALDPDARIGFQITGSGLFEAVDCVVWSNAESDTSVVVGGDATIETSHLCAVGSADIRGGSNVVTGPVLEGCRSIDDPLEDWTPPAATGPCQNNVRIVSQGDVTLSPGRYCGGLSASAKGRITLLPGVYIVSGGPLKLTADVEVFGEDVGIYLTGARAVAEITGQAEVHIVADDDGPMAGIALASDRLQTGKLETRLGGGATVDLVGTVYLPGQAFVWRGNCRSGEPSRVTQVIAATIDIAGTTDIRYEAAFEEEDFQPVTSRIPVAYLSH